MNFAFGALKGYFFLLFIAFFVGLFYNSNRKIFIIYGLIAVNLIALIEYYLNGVSTISIVLHRRAFYMPGLLSYEYFSFFSDNTLMYFRDSILRWVGFENPYKMGVPYLIGDIIYGKPNMAANTGLLGDDFSQLGWLCLVVYPFLRVKLLHYTLDSIDNELPPQLMFLVCFVFALNFMSGSFFTILLTGGFIVLYLLLKIHKY
jgi:hypothetical protein